MRLPLLSPSKLGPESQKLSGEMRKGIESNLKGFQAINSDGALVGRSDPWLRLTKSAARRELVEASPTLRDRFGRSPWNRPAFFSAMPALVG